MTLEIENPEQLELDDFITSSLIPKIQESFVKEIDKVKLIPINEYINKLNISTFGVYINAADILIAAVYNLIYTKQPSGNYIISIDSNQIAPNTRAKIIDIAQLVNYGTLSTPAYPIFDEVFSFFATRLNNLYLDYERGGW